MQHQGQPPATATERRIPPRLDHHPPRQLSQIKVNKTGLRLIKPNKGKGSLSLGGGTSSASPQFRSPRSPSFRTVPRYTRVTEYGAEHDSTLPSKVGRRCWGALLSVGDLVTNEFPSRWSVQTYLCTTAPPWQIRKAKLPNEPIFKTAKPLKYRAFSQFLVRTPQKTNPFSRGRVSRIRVLISTFTSGRPSHPQPSTQKRTLGFRRRSPQRIAALSELVEPSRTQSPQKKYFFTPTADGGPWTLDSSAVSQLSIPAYSNPFQGETVPEVEDLQ